METNNDHYLNTRLSVFRKQTFLTTGLFGENPKDKLFCYEVLATR